MAEQTALLKFFGPEALKGGLNTTDNPLIVPPNQMTQAVNLAIGRTLARKKRAGLTRYRQASVSYPPTATPGTDATAIRGIIDYWRYNASTGEPAQDVFLHQNAKVYSISSRTAAAIDRSGSLTLSTTAIPSYQVFEGVLYWVDSSASGYYKWDGTVTTPGNATQLTTAGTKPADGVGKYLRAHQGRMWMAGNPAFPFRLYYSSALTAEDWTGTGGTHTGGSIDLSYDGDPDGITSIFPPFQGRLYVATRRQIYQIDGSDPTNFVITPVTQGIGCISHQSVAATPNDIIFCSERGVNSLSRVQVSDQSQTTFLSRDIQKTWVTGLNRNLLSRCIGIYDENTNTYICTVVTTGQTKNTTTLVYNIEFGTWTTWAAVDARSLCLVLINNDGKILCGREDGEIAFLDDQASYDIAATGGFPMQFRTGKIFPDNDIATQYKFHSVTILCSVMRVSTINVGWNVDTIDGTRSGSRPVNLGQGADVLGSTFILGSSSLGLGQFNSQRVSVDLSGYNFQLTISVSGTSDIEFYGFIVEVSPEEAHTN